MPNKCIDYQKYVDDDGIEHEESIVRCYVCLDTIVAKNGKPNSSYKEKRQWFTNNGNPTYINVVVCNECFKNPLPSLSVLAQTIRDGERTVMERYGMPADIINKNLDKHFNLIEIKDAYLLKQAENQLKKQEMKEEIRNAVKGTVEKIKTYFWRKT